MEEPAINDVYKSLFHYTTDSGLAGILHTHSLWATHYRFMNDVNELHTFYKAVHKHLPGADYNKLKKNLANIINELDQHSPVFLTCFCAVSNEDKYEAKNGRLSQWRSYAKDGGYAIEFDTEKLQELSAIEARTEKTGEVCRHSLIGFSSVGYYCEKLDIIEDYESQGKYIQSLVKDAAEAIKKYDSSRQEYNEVIIKTFRCATRLKSYGFHEEKEIRLAIAANNKRRFELIKKLNKDINTVPTPKKVYFRPFDGVPYVVLFEEDNFNEPFKNAVKRILVGPGSHQDRRRIKVEMMLQEYGYEHVEVTCSDIPYVG